MQCPTCKGTGKFPDKLKICSVCLGKGKLPNNRLFNPECPICCGSGKYPSQFIVCNNCDGWGKLRETAEQGSMVFFLKTDTPWNSYQQLEKVFSELKGDIRISDPSFGNGSLSNLAFLLNCSSIRLLTNNVDNQDITFIEKTLHNVFSQHLHVEIRKTQGSDLHDRFIITNDELILLSHGLKNAGKRNSFITRLGQHLSGDIINTLSQAFDAKWQAGISLHEQDSAGDTKQL